jgi:hypothetical protein
MMLVQPHHHQLMALSTVLVGEAGDTPKSVLAYKDGLVAATASGNATGTNTIYRIGGDGTLSCRNQ